MCVYVCNVCVFVSVVVMCVMNEPTPRNIPCTCYLAKIKFLCFVSVSMCRCTGVYGVHRHVYMHVCVCVCVCV